MSILQAFFSFRFSSLQILLPIGKPCEELYVLLWLRILSSVISLSDWLCRDPTNTWNPAAQPPIPGQPRSASQSSGGDTPDAAWSAPPPNRSSPPSLGDNPGEDGSWSVNGDGKPPNWGGPLPSGPPRGGPPETSEFTISSPVFMLVHSSTHY